MAMGPDTIFRVALDAAILVTPTTTTFNWNVCEVRVTTTSQAEQPTVTLPPGDAQQHELLSRIASLADEPDTWGTYGKWPTQTAADCAARLAKQALASGHYPRFAPMARGGIELRYSSDPKTARLEVYNDGDVVLVTREASDAATEFDDVEADKAVAALVAFLG